MRETLLALVDISNLTSRHGDKKKQIMVTSCAGPESNLVVANTLIGSPEMAKIKKDRRT